MGIFDLFKKKKEQLTDEQKKMNKLWDLWAEGQATSPCAELMTYQSEINNGGHDQYFLNVESTGDLEKDLSVLETILPVKHRNNLNEAYQAYRVLEEKEDDESAAEILEQCDTLFYENEGEINHLLEAYAAKIEL